MNSRKWQVGMVALVMLSFGILSFAPFLWRVLRLKEKTTAIMLAVVGLLEALWFGLSTAQDSTGNEYAWGNVAGLFGILTILLAGVGAAWMFRPLRKEEIVPERGF